jgi:hypothetical protein
MGAGAATIIIQSRVEDIGQSRGIIAVGGSGNIGCAGGEILEGLCIGQTTAAKEG